MTTVSPGSAPPPPPVLLGLFRCLHPAVLLGLPALLPGLLPGLPPLYQLQAHCARAPALQWLQQRARWQGELAGQHVGGRPGQGYQGALNSLGL